MAVGRTDVVDVEPAAHAPTGDPGEVFLLPDERTYWTTHLLRLAKETKQCKLDNGQGAVAPTLSEADLALADSFLQDILSIFPLLGLGVFGKTVTRIKKPSDFLAIESKGIKASGYEDAKDSWL